MLRFPPAKINLGLYVTEKRPDGYHNLETVFYPVPELCDVLEAVPAAGAEAQMHLSGLPVAGHAADNLVWRAYGLLRAQFPEKIPPLDWYLHKVIPMGAGLGGGSADGAEALLLLNEVCDLRLSEAQLLAQALSLGSDCPFFISGKPCFATGRGEQLTPLDLSLAAYRVVVRPVPVHVRTGQAFGLLTPRPAPFDLRRLPEVPVAEWKNCIGNDFEAPVMALHPEIAAAKAQLYAEGAHYAQMSGSGSAVFGLFPR